MNKKHFTQSLFFLFCICSLLFFSCSSNNTESVSHNIPDTLLRKGDLVFRRGSGITSHVVLAADKEGMYSHIGIVTKDSSGWKVIHAVPGEPDRIKIEPIEIFFHVKRAKSGAVMRMETTQEVLCRAVETAMGFHKAGMSFDHQYDLSDTTKTYCTELIARIFQKEGIDITEGRRTKITIPGLAGEYILPSDIQQCSLVKTIYKF